MSTVFCKGRNIKSIIKLLPAEQIKHMYHVKVLVDVMAEKTFKCNIYSETADVFQYKYFGSAAFYHDIGKIKVPKEILLKQGKLTDEEIYILRKHTLFAREIFKLIKDKVVSGIPDCLINLAYDSAVYHHEWWNGQGYPYGISCKDIPLIARITSICDAYDAITSKRSYREAHDHCYACNELKRNAGTQFDPVLVKVFLDNEQNFSVI